MMVSSPGLCFSSGWRLPETLFMVFRLNSKGANVCKYCRSRQEISNELRLFVKLFQTLVHFSSMSPLFSISFFNEYSSNEYLLFTSI